MPEPFDYLPHWYVEEKEREQEDRDLEENGSMAMICAMILAGIFAVIACVIGVVVYFILR